LAKASTPNRLLSRLSAADFGLLQPHLTTVALPLRMRLETPRRAIEHVYFPESGFVSVVADGDIKVEVGLIGREGMTGLAVVHGVGRSPSETYVQNAGTGQRMPAAELSRAMDQSASLRAHLLRYAHTFLIQVMQTAKANARSKIEERLARWLLMAHDRLQTDELKITHEFLSVMLGVRRPGVTLAMKILEKAALVSTSRGGISIRSRAGLKRAANGAYGVAEAEFERVFG
jgi:CRP-like cAMP-binding protein